MKKKLTAMLLGVVMLFSAVFTGSVLLAAADNTNSDMTSATDGNISATKKVTQITVSDDNQIFQIDLTANSISSTTGESCDFVLVLDMSYSMTGENLEKLKEACLAFVNSLYASSKYSRVAIVTYGGDKNANTYYFAPYNDYPNGTYVNDATKTIMGIDSNYVDGNGNEDVRLFTNTGSKSQQWRIEESDETGYYYIVNAQNGECLDVTGATATEGQSTNVITYPKNESDAQKWKIISNSKPVYNADGTTTTIKTYTLESKVRGSNLLSAFNLDYANGNTSNGNNIIIWQDTETTTTAYNSNPQSWYIESSVPEYETYYWTNSASELGYGKYTDDAVADTAFFTVSQSDGTELNEKLIAAINNLVVYGGAEEGSHPGEAMEKAARILQAVRLEDANDYCEKTNEYYYNAQRGVLYFADGVPSPTDTVELENYPNNNWTTIEKYGIMYDFVKTYVDVQDALNWAKVLKYDKGENISVAVPEYNNGNQLTGNMQDPFNMYYINPAGIHSRNEYLDIGSDTNVTGCGADVYALTINLATMDITTCDSSHDGACNWTDMPKEDGTTVRVCLTKANNEDMGLYNSFSSRSNEFFYRLSSHRKDSTHVSFGSPYGRTVAQEAWHMAFRSSTAETSVAATGWSGRYPDFLCRNQVGNYFVSCDNTEKIVEVFQNIAVQIGKALKDLKIIDNITEYYEICDVNGNPLKEGDTIVNGDLVGTVCVNTDGTQYIVWEGVELNPGDSAGNGKKEFTPSFYVKPKDEFLGGNNVPTNSGAIIYDKDGNTLLEIPDPDVDVTVAPSWSVAPNVNVHLGAHLLEDVTVEDLQAAVTVNINGHDIDLSKGAEGNWGLEDWQTEYVNIEIMLYKVNDDNTVTAMPDGIKDIREDQKYQVQVSVWAKGEEDPGTFKGARGTIYVFYPELEFEDSTKYYYGEDVPTSDMLLADGNWIATRWKDRHGNYSDDDDVEMASDAPNLTITCTPDSSQYDTSGKLTRNDVKVDVEVGLIGYIGDSVTETTEEITSLCSFKHSDCADEINCSWNEDDDLDGSPAFLIHPQTCSLTIEKEGAEPEKDVAQTFLFKVSGGVAPFRVSDLKVSVEGNGSVTITGLPVGEYIVSEEESWGWRYELDKTKSVMAATLSGTTPKATIKAVNSRTNDSWLDGNSWAQNLFGDDGIIVKKKNGN